MISDTGASFLVFIREVLNALEVARVPYLVGGAVALWAWGEPRTTGDLDLVIELPIEAIGDLSRELEQRHMLVPVDIMLDLLLEDRADLPINAIHMVSGYKAEMFLLKPGDTLRQSGLQRRRLVDLGSSLGKVYVHSPEDLILNKLRYFRISRQSKHVRDIVSIIFYQRDALDMAYLERWIEALNLHAEWLEIQQCVAEL